MPLVLIIVGAVLLATAVNGTSAQFLGLLKGDLTGQNNFLFWLAAIAIIGAVGYVDELEPIADAFFALFVVVILLAAQKNNAAGGGFFGALQSQLKQTQAVS